MNVAKSVEDPRYIKVGKHLTDEEVEDVKILVKKYYDVFAWSYEDLGDGISIDVTNYYIPLNPYAKAEIDESSPRTIGEEKIREINIMYPIIPRRPCFFCLRWYLVRPFGLR